MKKWIVLLDVGLAALNAVLYVVAGQHWYSLLAVGICAVCAGAVARA